jgi:hypothetical protein
MSDRIRKSLHIWWHNHPMAMKPIHLSWCEASCWFTKWNDIVVCTQDIFGVYSRAVAPDNWRNDLELNRGYYLYRPWISIFLTKLRAIRDTGLKNSGRSNPPPLWSCRSESNSVCVEFVMHFDIWLISYDFMFSVKNVEILFRHISSDSSCEMWPEQSLWRLLAFPGLLSSPRWRSKQRKEFLSPCLESRKPMVRKKSNDYHPSIVMRRDNIFETTICRPTTSFGRWTSSWAVNCQSNAIAEFHQMGTDM